MLYVDFNDAFDVQLGNGVILSVKADEMEEVEYMPGTGCHAAFPEEVRAWTGHHR